MIEHDEHNCLDCQNAGRGFDPLTKAALHASLIRYGNDRVAEGDLAEGFHALIAAQKLREA